MPGKRTERVEDLIRQELSNLIFQEVKDPRVKMASVASVKVSRDLRHAVIGVSVLGSDEDRKEVVTALQHAKGFLRSQLASRTRLRVVPELEFELDRGAEHSQRISEILENL